MNTDFNKAVLLGCFLMLSSCSFGGPSYEIVREPEKYEVEVDTIDKLALEAVEQTKTDFFVPTFDDNAAWDRTKIFFVKYLKLYDLRSSIIKSNNTTVITSSNNSKYEYQVRKELFGNGYNYLVKCRPLGSGATYEAASRNAKNLSRFIVDGTLETTLLK